MSSLCLQLAAMSFVSEVRHIRSVWSNWLSRCNYEELYQSDNCLQDWHISCGDSWVNNAEIWNFL